jgi:O-antigen/teichoic acid export membrane protein
LRLKRLVAAAAAGYRRNHLVRNSGWLILGTGLNSVLGFFFWAIATHGYSTSAIGQASAVIAAMTFSSTLGLMGLGTTALQVLPQADDETWSTAVNTLVLGGAAVGLVLGAATAIVLPHISANLAFASRPATAVCIAVGVAVLTEATLLDYVFTAERAAHYVVIRGVSFGALKLALLIVLILFGWHSAPFLILAWVLASVVTTGATLAWQIQRLGRQHRYGLRGVTRYVRTWIKVLMYHHATTLGGLVVPSLMPVLVIARLSKVDSAYFYVAWLVSGILLTVSSAVAGNLLADLSYGEEAMGEMIRRAARLIAVLLLPPALILAVFGRQILGVFGATYAIHSYGLLLLFVIVAIPDAVTNVYVTVLRVRGLPQRAAVLNAVIAVVALAGGWWLMGPLGVAGAAWAWALAQTIGCCFVAVDSQLMRHANGHESRTSSAPEDD